MSATAWSSLSGKARPFHSCRNTLKGGSQHCSANSVASCRCASCFPRLAVRRHTRCSCLCEGLRNSEPDAPRQHRGGGRIWRQGDASFCRKLRSDAHYPRVHREPCLLAVGRDHRRYPGSKRASNILSLEDHYRASEIAYALTLPAGCHRIEHWGNSHSSGQTTDNSYVELNQNTVPDAADPYTMLFLEAYR